jgi:hypothetical protein
MNRKRIEAAAYPENRPLIKNDRELEQAQAKILICQALLANARRTLPPEAFRRESARRLEEWNRLDQSIRTYLTELPEGAAQRTEEEGEAEFKAAMPAARSQNTASVLAGQRVRLEFRMGSGELVQTIELRGARAWGMLQALSGEEPARPMPEAEIEAIKDRVDVIEAALIDVRQSLERLLVDGHEP